MTRTERLRHFARLGLGPEASWEECKKRYRTLAKKHHPDRRRRYRAERGELREETMRELNEAYHALRGYFTDGSRQSALTRAVSKSVRSRSDSARAASWLYTSARRRNTRSRGEKIWSGLRQTAAAVFFPEHPTHLHTVIGKQKR